MGDMLKGIKDIKDIAPARKMAICKALSGMDKGMMSKVMMCKSVELKAGLKQAMALCAVKKAGSGSGGHKTTTKKSGSADVCAVALKMVGVYIMITCMFVCARVLG